MQKCIFLLWVASVMTVSSAQKVLEKSMLATDITFLQIDATNCFSLKVSPHRGDSLIVRAKSEGEFEDAVVLPMERQGTGLYIKPGHRPNFVDSNDKLSAHKVVSIAVEVMLPEHRNVRIYGTGCHTRISGPYRNLTVTLNDGSCTLEKVMGSVDVRTRKGSIRLHAHDGRINAESPFGKVRVDPIPDGDNRYRLRTVTGDIRVIKTE